MVAPVAQMLWFEYPSLFAIFADLEVNEEEQQYEPGLHYFLKDVNTVYRCEDIRVRSNVT